jgi:hypothetical protein
MKRGVEMAEKTINEVISDMRGEVRWFRNAARKHALNAGKTVVTATRVAELVEQEAHMRVGDKLAEWVDRLEKSVSREVTKD